MQTSKTVGVFCKQKPAISQEILSNVVDWLRKHDCTVLMDAETTELLGETEFTERERIPELSRFLIVLGGDGTLLNVARLSHSYNVPVLAVNLGSLGFLTEITLDELYPMLERVLRNDYAIDQRMLLKATLIRGSQKVHDFHLLNDAVINKSVLARIVDLEVLVGNQYMTSYRADGLIISTPTGSTAYSLAAGGPIIHPSMEALVLSPICPFTLTNRPIIVPDDELIQVRLTTENENVRITIDGQMGCDMVIGDTLEIRKAETSFRLIKSPNKNYYQTLRKKLHWGRPADDSKT